MEANSVEELARLAPAAAEAVEAAGVVEAPSDWGIRLSDATYGGPGVFCWFSDQRQLLSFVAETLPLLPFAWDDVADDDLSKYRALRRDAHFVLARLAASEISWAAAQRALDEVFGSLFPIEWWGQFADLCAADSDFSRVVVRRFRKLRYDDTPSPVVEAEVADFMEFVLNYGV